MVQITLDVVEQQPVWQADRRVECGVYSGGVADGRADISGDVDAQPARKDCVVHGYALTRKHTITKELGEREHLRQHHHQEAPTKIILPQMRLVMQPSDLTHNQDVAIQPLQAPNYLVNPPAQDVH